MDSNGIMHKISCPYTSQQNGIAERKHRHLVETGLALLAYSHLPPKYWVESFTTAVYLINRLPTAVLKNKTPFQVLLNKIPNYSMLRIFGCACYPLLRPYTSHKLQFLSKQCIFLGYSSNHKGWFWHWVMWFWHCPVQIRKIGKYSQWFVWIWIYLSWKYGSIRYLSWNYG